jgi:hypothetical protein
MNILFGGQNVTCLCHQLLFWQPHCYFGLGRKKCEQNLGQNFAPMPDRTTRMKLRLRHYSEEREQGLAAREDLIAIIDK